MLIIGWCLFQSPNSAYPDTKLCPLFRIMYYVPVMAVVPPLSPPPRFPRPSSMSPNKLPTRAYLSPPLASSLSVFIYLSSPPVAPVVTRRPPELTGGRCHAAPGVLSSVAMFVGLPPRPVRLAVLC